MAKHKALRKSASWNWLVKKNMYLTQKHIYINVTRLISYKLIFNINIILFGWDTRFCFWPIFLKVFVVMVTYEQIHNVIYDS